MAKLPVLLAVGQDDFVHAGVKRLGETLQEQPGADWMLYEYANTEHVLIFSECTDNILSFLDLSLAR